MQFKHPEILYILFALLIPVLIHLFQLQRFTKVDFTNVKFLKQVALQTRKSSRLKKWLVLLSRLAAFAALIIAFAQPFFSKNDTSKEWQTSIYLDNSQSMSAKGEQGELLKRAVQDIAENIPDKGSFSLLTNNANFSDLTKSALIEQLKKVDYSPVQSSLNTVLLKANNLSQKAKDKHHRMLLFSDFQTEINKTQIPDAITFDFVRLNALDVNNVAIDSVFEKESNTTNRQINVVLKNQGKALKDIVLSANNKQIVLAKSTLSIDENTTKIVSLQIPKEHKNITIKLNHKDRFAFDNTYYISFANKENINVMLITNKKSFLEKIYTADEFNLTKNKVNQVAYEKVAKQELIILDDIENCRESLQTKLSEYVKNGGNLIVIPHKNSKVTALNQFFNKLGIGQISKKQTHPLKVTEIHYAHPILKHVFEKQVTNFQYPSVSVFYESMMPKASAILSFENKKPFVSQIASHKGRVYWVAAALDEKSSDFTKTSLVVPVFYNIAKQSSVQNRLSYRVGEQNSISISQKMDKDVVLHISNETTDFIPLQQIKSDNVILKTEENPAKAGFYSVTNKELPIQNLAYNSCKSESSTLFVDSDKLAENNKNIKAYSSIKNALSELASEQNIQTFFKWFLLLALLFLIIEILLLKYL